jgi:RNA polymerase sigma-70 factor (ECF subfamily)
VEGIGRMRHGAAPAWAVTVVEPERGVGELGGGPEPSPLDRHADERALVAATVAGRHEAFGILVERHRRQVYRICYRFTGNHHDASDLAQDTFVRAFRGLKSFRGQASLSTWLYRIAVNTCLNHAASARPAHEELGANDPADPTAERPDQRIDRAQRAARVRAAVAKLPARQRATLILRVYHDLSHDDIARTFGTSVGAVKANFFHALRNLRRLLGGQEGT